MRSQSARDLGSVPCAGAAVAAAAGICACALPATTAISNSSVPSAARPMIRESMIRGPIIRTLLPQNAAGIHIIVSARAQVERQFAQALAGQLEQRVGDRRRDRRRAA